MTTTRRVTWLTSYARSGSDTACSLIAGYLLDLPPREARLEAVLDTAPELVLLLGCGRMLPLDERMPYAAQTYLPPDAEVLDPYAAATGKVLYLIRDPRALVAEAVVTSPAAGGQRARLAGQLIQRIDAPGEGSKAWLAHVAAWTTPDRLRARFPGVPDIRVVRFEDLRRDPAGVLGQILEFIGLPEPVDAARIRRAVRDWTLEKVLDSAVLEMPPGASAFREPSPPVVFPTMVPALAEFGPEVEAAYQRRLRDNAEFAALVRQFGYER